jgi:hypothetical protein
MRLALSRVLLGAASAILALGAVMHGAAFFSSAAAVLDESRLPPFFVREMKVLWLADSTTLAALAAIFAFIAVKVREVPSRLITLTAVVPALTAALLYAYLGSCFPGHMLTLACLLAVIGGSLAPDTPLRGYPSAPSD